MNPQAANDIGSTGSARAVPVDMKLEVIVIPVSNVDRAKDFYANLGWRLDADRTVGDAFRLVQFTPPCSACSIQFGIGLTPAAPGSNQAALLIVSNIEAARQQLVGKGVIASEVFHCESGTGCRFPGIDTRVSGPHPDHQSYFSFVSFNDPDGNGWILQEVTARLPGRVGADTNFTSSTELAAAIRRAATAHREHEKRSGRQDENWPDWYAEYIVREQTGVELPL